MYNVLEVDSCFITNNGVFVKFILNIQDNVEW